MLKIPARFKQCDLSVSLAFDYCDCIVNMGTRAAACKQYYLPFMSCECLYFTVSHLLLLVFGMRVNDQ